MKVARTRLTLIMWTLTEFDIGVEVDVTHDTEEHSIPETTDNANEMSDQDVPIGTFFQKVK